MLPLKVDIDDPSEAAELSFEEGLNESNPITRGNKSYIDMHITCIDEQEEEIIEKK